MSNQRVICLLDKSRSPIYTDIKNDFVEIATDLEIDYLEEEIIYDSNERVSERGSQHSLNEEDPDRIESAVLISSDVITGDQLIASNIQERLESDTDSNDPQQSEAVEFEGDFRINQFIDCVNQELSCEFVCM